MKFLCCGLSLILVGLIEINSANAASIFKIATVAPEGSVWMKEMRAGAEALKLGTQGRVEIKYYPGGVMGIDSAVIRKVRLGQLQGGAFAGGEFSTVYKDAQAYGVPFLFGSIEEVDQVRSKVDGMLKQGASAAGWEVLGISGGFAYLMSTKPLKNKEDLRKSKVWMPQGDRVAQVAWKAAGVSPISLSLPDVLPALQTGMLETVGNTPSGAIAFQWHTRLKHLVDLPLTYATGYLCVDKKSFDKLTAPDQAVMRQTMGAAFVKIDSANRVGDQAAIGTLQKQGLLRTVLAPEEQTYWRSIGLQSEKELLATNALSTVIMQAIHAQLDATRTTQSARVPAAKAAAK